MTTVAVSEAAHMTFEQVRAAYQARKDTPSPTPVITPPPYKPVHLLTDDELQRGIQTCQKCGGIGYFRLEVPITDERFGKMLPCAECAPFAQELKRREQFVKLLPRIAPYSLLRGALLSHEFSNFDRAATEQEDGPNPHDVARTWALGVIGKAPHALPWAYIYGETGNGKTHLLAAAANGLTRARVPLIFATLPDTLAMILDVPMELRETFVKYLQTVPALLIDDFGTEKTTDWKVETTFRIINWRYTERRPTLFSSNIPPAYLPEIRISSRILDKAVCVVACNRAADYRQRAIDERKSVDL